jgi:predicted Zn-dependent peptidase
MNPVQLNAVVSNIFNTIEELNRDGLTEEELSMSKEQIKTELIMGDESAKNRMNSNGKSILFRGTIIPLEETIDKIDLVTLEQVKEFANKYLKKENCSISLVGNLDNIDKTKIIS